MEGEISGKKMSPEQVHMKMRKDLTPDQYVTSIKSDLCFQGDNILLMYRTRSMKDSPEITEKYFTSLTPDNIL